MSRLLLLIALILAASSLVFCQTVNSSTATLQQGMVQVDSIPLSDNLGAEKPPAAKSSAKAGNRNHGQEPVTDEDEPQGRFWGSVEYLLWKMKKIPEPAIVALSAIAGLVIYPLFKA